VRHLPTFDHLFLGSPQNRSCQQRFCARARKPVRRLSSIHFLTDFQDFSTVQHVPPRRQSWALALGFLFFSGCGPVVYLKEVSTRTAAALEPGQGRWGRQARAVRIHEGRALLREGARGRWPRPFSRRHRLGTAQPGLFGARLRAARSVQAKHSEDAPRPNQSCGEM
jgi:hypothetical protein